MDITLERSSEIETDRAAVEAELKRLLGEKRFAGAPMMSAFLRYIVTQKLDGNAGRIKAYTIGVDALGKPDSFDAQLDPSVRVLALRLRKTLKATYESSPADSVYIELKVGTYVPEFYKISQYKNPVIDTTGSTAAHRVMELPTSEHRLSDTRVMERIVAADSARPTGKRGAIRKQTTVIESLRDLRHNMVGLIFFSIVLLFALLSLRTATFSDRDEVLAKRSSTLTVQLAGLDAAGDVFDPQEKDTAPTLYLMNEFQHSTRLQQVSAQLGQSVMRAGEVNVVFTFTADHPERTSENHYTMLLSEVMVDNKARIDTQILRAVSGRMVSKATLLFDESGAAFTGEEIEHIEQLASRISNVDGPLYKDFCRKHVRLSPAHCQTARLPSIDAQGWLPVRRNPQNQNNDV